MPEKNQQKGDALSIAGGLLAVAGNLMAGFDAQSAAYRQASQYEDEAAYQQERTQYAVDVLMRQTDFANQTLAGETAIKLSNQRRSGALASGRLSAALGKSGVAFSGSAIKSMADVAAVNRTNLEIIKYNDNVQAAALSYNLDLQTAQLILEGQTNKRLLENQAGLLRDAGDETQSKYNFAAFQEGFMLMAGA